MEVKTLTVEEVEITEGTGLRGPKIRCPKCEWKPRATDLWMCSCGFEWNTFDTGGVCPGCVEQWMVTQCLSCLAKSPHSDWYDYD